jgi:hypothetical protein
MFLLKQFFIYWFYQFFLGGIMWKYLAAVLLILSGFHGGFGDTTDVDSIGKFIQKKMGASAIKIHVVSGQLLAKLFFYQDTLTDSLVVCGGIGRTKNIANNNTTSAFEKLCKGFFKNDSIIGPIKPFSLWSPKAKWFIKIGKESVCINLIAVGDAIGVK